MRGEDVKSGGGVGAPAAVLLAALTALSAAAFALLLGPLTDPLSLAAFYPRLTAIIAGFCAATALVKTVNGSRWGSRGFGRYKRRERA